jgi:hypothetical protein
MEQVWWFRVPNAEVWFVQAVLTDAEGAAVVSLGRREEHASIISVLFDSSTAGEVAPLVDYLVTAHRMEHIEEDAR